MKKAPGGASWGVCSTDVERFTGRRNYAILSHHALREQANRQKAAFIYRMAGFIYRTARLHHYAPLDWRLVKNFRNSSLELRATGISFLLFMITIPAASYLVT